MSRAILPPRPDPDTGEPRPPRAPVEDSWVPDYSGPVPRPTRKLPPPTEGPMLEWYRPSRTMLKLAAGIGFGAPATVFLINWVASGEGWDYIPNSRPGWLAGALAIMLLSSLVLYNSVRTDFIAAGAGWVAHNTGWVHTYDLVWISIEFYSEPHLNLVDSQGRNCHPPLVAIQYNRDLWDLVYNGILHSIHDHYVRTDANARRILEIQGPALRNDARLRHSGPRPDEMVIVPRRRWYHPRRYRRGQRQE
jgi:hypothetical protein